MSRKDGDDTGRIALKVINHFGDEVMQVFPVWLPGNKQERQLAAMGESYASH